MGSGGICRGRDPRPAAISRPLRDRSTGHSTLLVSFRDPHATRLEHEGRCTTVSNLRVARTIPDRRTTCKAHHHKMTRLPSARCWVCTGTRRTLVGTGPESACIALRPKPRGLLSRCYMAGKLAAVGIFIVLPYAEEFWCYYRTGRTLAARPASQPADGGRAMMTVGGDNAAAARGTGKPGERELQLFVSISCNSRQEHLRQQQAGPSGAWRHRWDCAGRWGGAGDRATWLRGPRGQR
jgi:hypothetical protein